MEIDVPELTYMAPPSGMDSHIGKVGHIVLQVTNLELSTDFHTRVLAFEVSAVYPENMIPGGMVFRHCGTDRHCLALIRCRDRTRT